MKNIKPKLIIFSSRNLHGAWHKIGGLQMYVAFTAAKPRLSGIPIPRFELTL